MPLALLFNKMTALYQLPPRHSRRELSCAPAMHRPGPAKVPLL